MIRRCLLLLVFLFVGVPYAQSPPPTPQRVVFGQTTDTVRIRAAGAVFFKMYNGTGDTIIIDADTNSLILGAEGAFTADSIIVTTGGHIRFSTGTALLTKLVMDSLVTALGRFGNQNDTAWFDANHDGVFESYTTGPLFIKGSSSVTLSKTSDTITITASGSGTGLTYLVEADAGDTSKLSPVSPNTIIYLTGTVIAGDSGQTHITNLRMGINADTWLMPTVKGSNGQIWKYTTTGDSMYWFTPNWTLSDDFAKVTDDTAKWDSVYTVDTMRTTEGELEDSLDGYSLTTHDHSGTYEPASADLVTDAILADSLNSYFDTAAVVDTILSSLTDANIPNTITISLADSATGAARTSALVNKDYGQFIVEGDTARVQSLQGIPWMQNQYSSMTAGWVPIWTQEGENLYAKWQAAPWLTTETGDISGITAWGGVQGGGTSGAVSVNVECGAGLDTTSNGKLIVKPDGATTDTSGGTVIVHANLTTAITTNTTAIGKVTDDTTALIAAKDSVAAWDNGAYPYDTTTVLASKNFVRDSGSSGGGWPWSDSSSYGPDSVLFAHDVDTTAGNVTTFVANALAADAIVGPSFSEGAKFFGPLEQQGVIPTLTWEQINKAFCAPPKYFIGDTANFPGCTTQIPFRYQRDSLSAGKYWGIADTNFIDSNGIMHADSQASYPKPYDSVRITAPPVDSSGIDNKYAIYKDSSVGIHVSIVAGPGWPADTMNKQRYAMAFTPYGISGTSDAIENGNIVYSNDGVNFTNKVGPTAGDTIINPMYSPSDFIVDTIFWYHHAADPHAATWFDYQPDTAGTGWQLQDTTFRLCATMTRDPELILDKDGKLWYIISPGFTETGPITGHTGSFTRYLTYAASSVDGKTWSSFTKVLHAGGQSSPSVILDTAGTYKAWAIYLADYDWPDRHVAEVWRYSMSRIDTIWTEIGECTFEGAFKPDTCASGTIWHLDVSERSPKDYIMVFGGRSNCNVKLTQSSRDYWFGLAQSVDGGATWKYRESPIYSTIGLVTNPVGERNAEWDSAIYRPSMIWLNNDRTMGRIYYTGAKSGPWHISYMDLNFNGNDSTFFVPLTVIPGYDLSTDMQLSYFRVRSGVLYFAIDSAMSASADDTIRAYGMMTEDCWCDSMVIEFKTSSANEDSIRIDSLFGLRPTLTWNAARGTTADQVMAGVNLDTSSTSVIRIAKAFNAYSGPTGFRFRAGEMGGMGIVIDAANSGEKFFLTYAALKCRRR